MVSPDARHRQQRTGRAGEEARGGEVHQHRAASGEVAGAATPASPAAPGSQGPMESSPAPRYPGLEAWSCQGRRAHNPACAGVAEAAGAPPVLGCRDGHEHRARGARNPGRYPHLRSEEGRRRRRGRVARERVRHHPDWSLNG